MAEVRGKVREKEGHFIRLFSGFPARPSFKTEVYPSQSHSPTDSRAVCLGFELIPIPNHWGLMARSYQAVSSPLQTYTPWGVFFDI